jgi:hypothetical protein
VRTNSGSRTSAEATMETSLMVSEADKMLSRLASGGHLQVESSEGTLVHTLSGRRTPALEG